MIYKWYILRLDVLVSRCLWEIKARTRALMVSSRLPDEPVDAREAVAVAARALMRSVEHAVAVAAQVFLRRNFITDALREAGRVLVLPRRAGHERSQRHSVQMEE